MVQLNGKVALVTGAAQGPGKALAPHLAAEGVTLAMAQAACEGEPVTAEDVSATLPEMNHETLHVALANLWFLFLTHPDHQDRVAKDRRLM